jgi:hypothetical protein
MRCIKLIGEYILNNESEGPSNRWRFLVSITRTFPVQNNTPYLREETRGNY